MANSTAMCTSFKSDILSGLHCFNATTTFTATGTSTVTWTSVSALTGLCVGMTLSGTNVAAGTILASIDSATQITVSKASTGALGTVTATGDGFKIALYTSSATLGAATTAYSASNEISGTGYTAAGQALANNTSPATSGTTAYITWSANPSWTSATFTANAALIYNNSRRGPVATPSCSTHAFGGDQSVTAGTFTAVLPTADASNAIIRIG